MQHMVSFYLKVVHMEKSRKSERFLTFFLRQQLLFFLTSQAFRYSKYGLTDQVEHNLQTDRPDSGR